MRFISILLLVASAVPCGAKVYAYQLNCDSGKGEAQTMSVAGSRLSITPEGHLCTVAVTSPGGNLVFERTAIGIQAFAGKDFTGDGEPDAVIQIDSTPYRVFVVSLGSHPGVVGTIENGYGFWLRDDCDDQHIRIWTSDAAFQNDKELVNVVYHYDLFVPEIALEVRDKQVLDATPLCKRYFDDQVRRIRLSLKTTEISRFRAGQIRDEFRRGVVKGDVLKIIFAYLYSGREAQAKAALSHMWPQDDVQRIWAWMTERRSVGLLRQTKPLQDSWR